MDIAITIPQLFVIAGLLLIMAELFVGIEAGFDLVLIGSILILSGFAGIISSNIFLMLVIATVLSIFYMVYGRSKIRAKVTVMTHKTNIDKLPGKKGVVIRTITPDTAGIIRIDDEDWRAAASEVIYEKDHATVESLQGVTLTVSKFKKSKKLA